MATLDNLGTFPRPAGDGNNVRPNIRQWGLVQEIVHGNHNRPVAIDKCVGRSPSGRRHGTVAHDKNRLLILILGAPRIAKLFDVCGLERCDKLKRFALLGPIDFGHRRQWLTRLLGNSASPAAGGPKFQNQWRRQRLTDSKIQNQWRRQRLTDPKFQSCPWAVAAREETAADSR